MLDLEKAIEEWRKGMPERLSGETIDELECHLRDAVSDLVQSGMVVDQAFERAAKELGLGSGLAREFQKMEQGTWLPIKFAVGVELLAFAAGVILLFVNLDSPGLKFLLVSHVVLVTIGYSTTFLIGALGICYVSQRSFSGFPRMQLRVLARATFVLGCVAALATMAAIVLGSFWANAAWGRYWGWDMREVGGLAVVLWQLTFLAAHWFVQRNERVLVLMSIWGNVVVGWAWFGVNFILEAKSYGTAAWTTLVIALTVHCALFVAGLAQAGWLRRSKAA
jgi:hypothetical protein